jgi:hypothetical protein
VIQFRNQEVAQGSRVHTRVTELHHIKHTHTYQVRTCVYTCANTSGYYGHHYCHYYGHCEYCVKLVIIISLVLLAILLIIPTLCLIYFSLLSSHYTILLRTLLHLFRIISPLVFCVKSYFISRLM